MGPLLKQINELYGLQVNSFEKVTKGFLSENYILIDGDKKYFLKKYCINNREKIEEIHLAKKYFADGGIPVILPLVDKENNTFFIFDDNYFSLSPFIYGREIERGTFSDTAIISLGKMLGNIHLLGKKAKLPINDKFRIWDKEKILARIELIKKEIDKIEVLNDFDELAIKNINLKKNLILKGFDEFGDLNLPSDHLTHGDYSSTNIFFGDNDEVSYVFDLEKAKYAPRMYELFKSIMYDFLINGEVTNEKIKNIRLYLGSYLEVYPTSIEELKKGLRLYYVKSVHVLWVEDEHYLKNNNRADQFLLSDFERIEYFSKHLEEFEKSCLNKPFE